MCGGDTMTIGVIFMLLFIENVDMKKCANLGGP
jgi:hypothetical protein